MLMESLLGKKAIMLVLGWSLSAVAVFSGWIGKQVWDSREDHEKRIIVLEANATQQTALLIEIRDTLKQKTNE